MKACKLFAVCLISFAIVISSCKKKEPTAPGPTTFTLQLKAKYGNQNFELNSPNIDPQGRYIFFTDLNFYLSHINLVKSDGSTVSVASVALFNFGDSMLTVSASNIQGNFTGINFACGLDSLTNTAANADNITTIVPPNPLSNYYAMTWPMLNYVFEQMDGKWDVANVADYANGVGYHIGTNAAYRPNIQLNQSFSVSGNPYTMVMYIDVQQIFYNTMPGGDTVNVATEPSTMSESVDNPAILPAFCNNFSRAFSLSGP